MTEKIYDEAVRSKPYLLEFVSTSFKTQEMCIKEVTEDPWDLAQINDHFETQVMCDDAVFEDPCSFQFASNWFVMQKLVKYVMMTKIIAMMMSLLSGIMDIKIARH